MPKKWSENIYCNHPFKPSRLQTREVSVGSLLIGSAHPLRIQSMTNTPTMDTGSSVRQCIRIIDAGADLVRLTSRNIAEAENLANIKKELRDCGYHTPLIADIHFNPRVAETAARIVEKIRINPGNYISKTDGNKRGIIEKSLKPLITICKDHHTAMRIGVNHGSLSERILKQFGDTPRGMVESALEYLRVCQDQDFHQVVFSMKSSNTLVMIRAYRLLVHKMLEQGIVYPLHLGVTEAGEGEDGRLKSAVGIGSLLADGIGDTIRVSLTEDPEFEIPVAGKLAALFQELKSNKPDTGDLHYPVDPFEYQKRLSDPVLNIGGTSLPVVIADCSGSGNRGGDLLDLAGYVTNSQTGYREPGDRTADYLYFGNTPPSFALPDSARGILEAEAWKKDPVNIWYFPVFSLEDFLLTGIKSDVLNFIKIKTEGDITEDVQICSQDPTAVYILEGTKTTDFHFWRSFFAGLIREQIHTPVILKACLPAADPESLQLEGSVMFGGLFADGLGDGAWLTSSGATGCGLLTASCFGILQASRVRTTRTEFISCPSCGRTLFNILEATSRIRKKTGHLKGLKIGIMGCIVNGPGEMADADYGYVGSGPGKVNIYKARKIIRRNVSSEVAVEELIKVIKENGDWMDP